MAAASLHAFGFQTGEWRVRHRKLKARLAGSHDWIEFDGTCRAWEILEGAGNVDDHWLNDPKGAYQAATVRRKNPESGLWSIWWIDARFGGLGPPVHGSFENGIGTFSGVDELGSKPIDVRYIWSNITPTTARWEQAFSWRGTDQWEINWVMEFTRAR